MPNKYDQNEIHFQNFTNSNQLRREHQRVKQHANQNIVNFLDVYHHSKNNNEFTNELLLCDDFVDQLANEISFLVSCSKDANDQFIINSILPYRDVNKLYPYRQIQFVNETLFKSQQNENETIDNITNFLTKQCNMNLDKEFKLYSSYDEFAQNQTESIIFRYAPSTKYLQFLFISVLNLNSIGLNSLDSVSKYFPNLLQLNVNNNQIQEVNLTDTVLYQLNYLNISDNPINNNCINQLQYLPNLDKLFIYNTNISMPIDEIFMKLRGLSQCNHITNPFPLTPSEQYALLGCAKNFSFYNKNSIDNITIFKLNNAEVPDKRSSLFEILKPKNLSAKDFGALKATKMYPFIETFNGEKINQKDVDINSNNIVQKFDIPIIITILNVILSIVEKIQYALTLLRTSNIADVPSPLTGSAFVLFSWLMNAKRFFYSFHSETMFPQFLSFFFYIVLPPFLMLLMCIEPNLSKLQKYHSKNKVASPIFFFSLLISCYVYDMSLNGFNPRFAWLWWALYSLLATILFSISWYYSTKLESTEIIILKKRFKEKLCLVGIVLFQLPTIKFLLNMRCGDDGLFVEYPSLDCGDSLLTIYSYVCIIIVFFIYAFFETKQIYGTLLLFTRNVRKLNSLISNSDDDNSRPKEKAYITMLKAFLWRFKRLKYFFMKDGKYKLSKQIEEKLEQKTFKNFKNYVNLTPRSSKYLVDERNYFSAFLIIIEFIYKILLAVDEAFSLGSWLTLFSSIFIFILYIIVPPYSNWLQNKMELSFTLGTVFLSLSTITENFNTISILFLILTVILWVLYAFILLYKCLGPYCCCNCETQMEWFESKWFSNKQKYPKLEDSSQSSFKATLIM